jgi:uncharacterized protein YkwD/uncharacterized membrane protein required for colicin V production
MIANLVIVAALFYSAYVGTKRGFILIGLELVSFIIATCVALAAYHPVGTWLHALPSVTLALGEIGAFVLIWVFIEIVCALIMRLTILPHIIRRRPFSRVDQAGGAVLNTVRGLILITLALIVFSGLPISASTKQPVAQAALAKLILADSGRLQTWLNHGLGGDLNQSLNFFTVTADPESTEHINLGYTTTGTADPADEEAMLTLVNQERTSRGIKPLVMDQKIRHEARAYSQEMFQHGYFSHIDPEGNNPFERMTAAGIKYDVAGENLALAPTLQLAHQGLMNSPPHRANILDPSFHKIGIGIENGGPYGLMITQDFTD